MIDLHQHSVFSDGTDTVEELLEKNRQRGIRFMALTDHDTTEGCERLLKGGRLSKEGEAEIAFLTGIEFSTEDDGDTVHILVYDYAPGEEAVGALVARGQLFRRKRSERLLNHLKENFQITFGEEQLKKIATSKNPNKPMLANFLIELGYAKTVGEAIETYLNVHYSDLKLSSREVIEGLNGADCLTVWAHPLGEKKEFSFERTEKRLNKFSEWGLLGLECWYSQYTAEECAALSGLARERGLLVTCGSDYHGKNKTVSLGQVCSDGAPVPYEEISLLSACKRLHRI